MRSTGHEASGSQKQYIIGRSRASHIYSAATAPMHLHGLEALSRGSGEAQSHRHHHEHQPSSGSHEDFRSGSKDTDGEQEGKSSRDIDEELEKIYHDAELGIMPTQDSSAVNPHSVLGEMGDSQVLALWQGRKSTRANQNRTDEADLALRRLQEWNGGALSEQELAIKITEERQSEASVIQTASLIKPLSAELAPEPARKETEEFACRLSRVRAKLMVINQRVWDQTSKELTDCGAPRIADLRTP